MHNKGRLKPLLHFLQRGIKILQDFNTGAKKTLSKTTITSFSFCIHLTNTQWFVLKDQDFLWFFFFYKTMSALPTSNWLYRSNNAVNLSSSQGQDKLIPALGVQKKKLPLQLQNKIGAGKWLQRLSCDWHLDWFPMTSDVLLKWPWATNWI